MHAQLPRDGEDGLAIAGEEVHADRQIDRPALAAQRHVPIDRVHVRSPPRRRPRSPVPGVRLAAGVAARVRQLRPPDARHAGAAVEPGAGVEDDGGEVVVLLDGEVARVGGAEDVGEVGERGWVGCVLVRRLGGRRGLGGLEGDEGGEADGVWKGGAGLCCGDGAGEEGFAVADAEDLVAIGLSASLPLLFLAVRMLCYYFCMGTNQTYTKGNALKPAEMKYPEVFCRK